MDYEIREDAPNQEAAWADMWSEYGIYYSNPPTYGLEPEGE